MLPRTFLSSTASHRYKIVITKIGCGGYVNGNGTISTPNYLANSGIADCIWFIEARQNEDAILLRMANSSETKVPQTIPVLSHPAMIASLFLFHFLAF